MKKTLIKLCSIKMYSKFDIIIAFNEIRIKKENEKKTTFSTRYELFEYVIISFELFNISEIFQAFINVTLKEYFDDFYSKYIDDVIVYNDIKNDHMNHVFKILIKLKKAKLYLNIDKFEFFVISIKYFKLIITTNEIEINFKKMNIDVTKWEDVIDNMKNWRNINYVELLFTRWLFCDRDESLAIDCVAHSIQNSDVEDVEIVTLFSS